MRSFYLAWTKELQKLQQPVGESTSKILSQPAGELAGSHLPQPVAEIPWGHNMVLLAKLKTPLIRLWYPRPRRQQRILNSHRQRVGTRRRQRLQQLAVSRSLCHE